MNEIDLRRVKYSGKEVTALRDLSDVDPAEADAGFMSALDKLKLDGIEPGATADQTPAEILAAIKTVDGSGSGLDADNA